MVLILRIPSNRKEGTTLLLDHALKRRKGSMQRGEAIGSYARRGRGGRGKAQTATLTLRVRKIAR